MRFLPRLPSGMPIPKFATWSNGKPNLTVMDMAFAKQAIEGQRCFICSQPLGRHKAFVGGPKSVASKAYAEPPFHRDCAEFGLSVCPFIVQGRSYRKNKPSEAFVTNTNIDPENPNIFGLVIASRSTYYPHHQTFLLQDPAPPVWWSRGRLADKNEIDKAESVVSQTLSYLSEAKKNC